MSEVDRYFESGKRIRETAEAPIVKGTTEEAFDEYESLDTPPAVNRMNGRGCPDFWDKLRHFVDGDHHYWLYRDWRKWLQQQLPQHLDDSELSPELWKKLLGYQEDPYRLEIDGQEYLFERGKFLYGSEIQSLGAILDEIRDVLLASCPDDSRVCYATLDQEGIKDEIESEEFVNHFIETCCAVPDGWLLWYRACP